MCSCVLELPYKNTYLIIDRKKIEKLKKKKKKKKKKKNIKIT